MKTMENDQKTKDIAQVEVKKEIKSITITKVVTRNFIMDFVAHFQNLIGTNLTSYEKMIQKGIAQIAEDLKERKIKLSWYRYEITQLTNGAIAIMFYGDELQ